MMKVKFVESNGRREWAVLPYDEFLRLIQQAEMKEEAKEFEQVKAAMEKSAEEADFSSETLYNMLNRSKHDYTRIQVNFEKDQIQILDEVAKRARITRSELVREYVDTQLFVRFKQQMSSFT